MACFEFLSHRFLDVYWHEEKIPTWDHLGLSVQATFCSSAQLFEASLVVLSTLLPTAAVAQDPMMSELDPVCCLILPGGSDREIAEMI